MSATYSPRTLPEGTRKSRSPAVSVRVPGGDWESRLKAAVTVRLEGPWVATKESTLIPQASRGRMLESRSSAKAICRMNMR